MTYLPRGIFFLTINDQTRRPFAIVVSLLSIELSSHPCELCAGCLQRLRQPSGTELEAMRALNREITDFPWCSHRTRSGADPRLPDLDLKQIRGGHRRRLEIRSGDRRNDGTHGRLFNGHDNYDNMS
ncbi:hypothetical protein NL676_008121 [Syzygium grande]|nr:hypothetical protein NL676_008121 [Syzygium grande]